MERHEMKPELMALGMEILAELQSIGMDEIEIMNFWQECIDKAKTEKPKPYLFDKFTQN